MPLELLGILVVVGLAAVIFAVHFSTRFEAATDISEQRAKERFATDFPGFTPDNFYISADRKNALLVSSSSRDLGLVYKFGSKEISRLLRPSDIRAFEASGECLLITLFDFTLPRVSISISDSRNRELLISVLEEMSGD